MIDCLSILKQYIINYSNYDRSISIPQEVWESITSLIPLFNCFRKIIQNIESDEFGTISYVLKAFNSLRRIITFLPSKFQSGIESYLGKEFSIWKHYEFCWTPLLFAATRFNPSIDINQLLTSKEITQGDNFIMALLEEISPVSQQESMLVGINEDSFYVIHLKLVLNRI